MTPYTIWNFAGDHPLATVLVVIVISLSAIDISGNIAKAIMARRASGDKEK